MENSQEYFNSESAKSLPKRSVTWETYAFYEAAKPLKPLGIKMVGARGFEQSACDLEVERPESDLIRLEEQSMKANGIHVGMKE